jgi:hypothetical protein
MQVSHTQTPVTHPRTLLLYLILAELILLGILIEGFLIGTSIFAGTAWGTAAHSALGLLLLLLTLLLPLAALLARLSGKMTIWSAVLFVLTLLQVTLAGFAKSVPFLAALHPSNAMLMFGLNVFLIIQGWHMRGKKSPEMEQLQTANMLRDNARSRSKVPLEINLSTGGYILYALISVGVLTLFLLNRNDVVNTVRALNPGFSPREIDGSVFSIQMIVVGAHLLFGTCTACLAFLIRTGKNWVRIVSSVVTGLVVLEICYEWSSPTDVPAVLASNQRIYAFSVQMLMILMVLSCVMLQWVPQASRDFFSARKRQVS